MADVRWGMVESGATDAARPVSCLIRLFSVDGAFLLCQREYLARDFTSSPNCSAVDKEDLSIAS